MILYLLSKNPELSKYLMGILSITWKTPILLTDIDYIQKITHPQPSIFIITPDIDSVETVMAIRNKLFDSVVISYREKNAKHSRDPLPKGVDFAVDDIHFQDRNIQFLVQSIYCRLEANDLKKKNENLTQNLKEWESLFQDSLDLMFIIDAHSKSIVEINHAVSIILGYSREDLKGSDFGNIFKPESEIQPQDSGFYGSTIVSQGLITKDGKWIPMESTWRLFTNNGMTHIIATFRDISERRESEAKIQQLAFYDPISNLPNKIFFSDRLKDILLSSKTHNTKFGLVSIDIDNFKLINETLGSDIGNRIIRRVGDRIDDFNDRKKFLAHFGGDDYCMILEEVGSMEDFEFYIHRLQTYLRKPIQVEGRDFYLTYTMGLSMFPNHGDSSSDLMKASDMALYRSKDKGRNSYTIFSHEMVKEVERRMEIENDLRKAIHNEEFMMFYQPQVSIDDLSLCGMEALIRWNHPTKGLIPPDVFIPIAEVTGLIKEIGEFVLKQSCQTTKQWMQRGLLDFPVSVNMSARQWSSVNIHDEIMKVITDTGLPCSHLNLELTESSIMQDPESSISVFHNLIQKGIGFSVDDFGTGYSSLSYLKKLSVHHLKIDRSFIIDIEYNDSDRSIATAIIQLAHSLGLKVIAEGVETSKQFQILKNLGCDQIQGFYIARPMAEKDFEDFVQSYREWKHEVFAENRI